MEFKEIISFVRDLGFPAAVALFVLWRLDNRLKELVDRLYTMVQEEQRGHMEMVKAIKELERIWIEFRVRDKGEA